MAIEHRLAPPRHPHTNGMVEWFNGRIGELLQQTRFDSRADVESPHSQRAIAHGSPQDAGRARGLPACLPKPPIPGAAGQLQAGDAVS